MAYANTVLDEYRLLREKSNLDKYENRWGKFGAFQAYLEDTPNTIPGYQELINAYDGTSRTVSIIVMNRQTLTTSATRSCSMTSTQATSTYVTPSWTVLVTAFKMVPAEHRGNYLKYQEIFNFQVESVERAFLTALDTAAYTNLEANHTTVLTADDNPYNLDANSNIVVPNADAELAFNEMPSVMMANSVDADSIKVVASHRLAALVRELNAQGPGNEANRAFQFGPYSFYHSNVVNAALAAGERDIAFFCPKGSLYFLSYVDVDSQLGNVADGHKWSVEYLPQLGLNVGLLYTADCTDESSIAHGATSSSMSESFQWSLDYSFGIAYDSGSGQGTPIFKALFTTT